MLEVHKLDVVLEVVHFVFYNFELVAFPTFLEIVGIVEVDYLVSA